MALGTGWGLLAGGGRPNENGDRISQNVQVNVGTILEEDGDCVATFGAISTHIYRFSYGFLW